MTPTLGSCDLVRTWGSDEEIIEAARMSTGKGFFGWGPRCANCRMAMVETLDGPSPANYPDGLAQRACRHVELVPGDEKLLRYLWTHRHTSPFEMAGATFRVTAPLFVFREWHRHRTQSFNEFSARYAQMPDAHYVPTIERTVPAATANKQAQGATLTLASEADRRRWLAEAERLQGLVYEHYELGLSLGIPKEVARLNTPVARHSTMMASANLLNWLRFLGLRDTDAAQWEIRQFAIMVREHLRQHFPRTLALADEAPL